MCQNLHVTWIQAQSEYRLAIFWNSLKKIKQWCQYGIWHLQAPQKIEVSINILNLYPYWQKMISKYVRSYERNIWTTKYVQVDLCGSENSIFSLVLTKHSEERRFLYFNHLYKKFLEQMISHLKALYRAFRISKKIGRGIVLRVATPP